MQLTRRCLSTGAAFDCDECCSWYAIHIVSCLLCMHGSLLDSQLLDDGGTSEELVVPLQR